MLTRKTSFFLGCITGVIGVIALAAVILLSLSMFFKEQIANYSAKRLKAPPVPMDMPADYDWSVLDLNGQPLELTSLKGQVVFLTFWSPTCGICMSELGSLQRMYEKMADKIAFVSVITEHPEKLEETMSTWEVSFPVYTKNGSVPDMFDIRGTPTTFILSPEGTVAFSYVGPANWDDPQSIDFLEKLALMRISTEEQNG